MRLFNNFTVEDIHQDIDSAQDRLLKAAEHVISLHKPIIDVPVLSKAKRLKDVGFSSAADVVRASYIKKDNKKIAMTNKQADIIRYYKRTYPLYRFITESEFERICNKYNLVYSQIGAYTGEVPDKNLAEIENAHKLSPHDTVKSRITVKIKKFWPGVPRRVRKALKKPFTYTGDMRWDGTLGESDLRHFLEDKIDFCGYVGNIFEDEDTHEEDRSGLFIAAPPSQFNLDGKVKHGLGYFTVRKIEDPIVFRYVRGGIQIITKWGAEASDPMVTNAIDN